MLWLLPLVRSQMAVVVPSGASVIWGSREPSPGTGMLADKPNGPTGGRVADWATGWLPLWRSQTTVVVPKGEELTWGWCESWPMAERSVAGPTQGPGGAANAGEVATAIPSTAATNKEIRPPARMFLLQFPYFTFTLTARATVSAFAAESFTLTLYLLPFFAFLVAFSLNFFFLA